MDIVKNYDGAHAYLGGLAKIPGGTHKPTGGSGGTKKSGSGG